MSANSIQIGGDHYAADVQHWDVVETYGIGYLEGCATKYLTRWRKKNGLEDLLKSRHYTEKLRELSDLGVRFPRGRVPNDVIASFLTANEVDTKESVIITTLFTWNSTSELYAAIANITSLIDAEENATPSVRTSV